MQHVSGIEDKARAARNKKAVYGTDVDLESYESEAKPQETVDDAEDLPSAVKKAALDVGVKLDAESSGDYVQMDQTPVVAKSLYEGVEIMDMASALEKYDFCRTTGGSWWHRMPTSTQRMWRSATCGLLHPGQEGHEDRISCQELPVPGIHRSQSASA